MPTLRYLRGKQAHISGPLTVWMDSDAHENFPGTSTNTNTWALTQTDKSRHSGVEPQHGDVSSISPGESILLFYFHRERKHKGEIWNSICGISGNRKQGKYFREQMAEGFSNSLKIPSVVGLLLPFLDRARCKSAAPIATKLELNPLTETPVSYNNSVPQHL